MTTLPIRTPGHGPASRAALVALVLVAAAAVGVAIGLLSSAHGRAHPGVAAAPRTAAGRPATLQAGRRHPNIVFVLTDDLSMDLLPYMPQVQALQSDGMTFHNYFVSDSLCCPSRTSIFTGEFPHDSGVFTNSGPFGGLNAFYHHDDENRTFNIALHDAGYRTAMMGKYINGYLAGARALAHRPRPACRPGGRSGTWPAGAIASSTTSSTSTAPFTSSVTPHVTTSPM